MQKGVIKPGARVLIVDDVVGSGATLESVVQLVRDAGGEAVEAAVLAAVPGLHGVALLREKVKVPVYVMLGEEEEGERETPQR